MSVSDANGGIAVSYGLASLSDYVRLSTMFCRSPEIARFQGPVVRAIAPILSAIFFGIALLSQRRPHLIAAKCNGRLVGGLTLSQFGNLETAVIDKRHVLGEQCYGALSRQVETIMSGESDRRFGYWTLKPTMVHAGVSRGFRRSGREGYVVTADLGPFRCSWISHRPIKRRRVSCAQMSYMIRDVA